MKIEKITINDLYRLGSKKDDMIRNFREPLLAAFDIYKSNVMYGIEEETEAERLEILKWYQDLLDKKVSALVDIPEKIRRYYL